MKKKRYLFASLGFTLLGASYFLASGEPMESSLIILLLCCILASNHTVAYEVSDEESLGIRLKSEDTCKSCLRYIGGKCTETTLSPETDFPNCFLKK